MWALVVLTIVAGAESAHVADYNLTLDDCRAAAIQYESAYCELMIR